MGFPAEEFRRDCVWSFGESREGKGHGGKRWRSGVRVDSRCLKRREGRGLDRKGWEGRGSGKWGKSSSMGEGRGIGCWGDEVFERREERGQGGEEGKRGKLWRGEYNLKLSRGKEWGRVDRAEGLRKGRGKDGGGKRRVGIWGAGFGRF